MPRVLFNAGVSSREVLKNVGFNFVYRWQDAFYWQSSFVSGKVPAFGSLDGQLSFKLPAYNSIIKVGGSNLLNQYYNTSLGNPLVGGMYYVSVIFNEIMP
jgi:outer membrane receptor protein involved in Fe transport